MYDFFFFGHAKFRHKDQGAAKEKSISKPVKNL
jgi:hypothetical protein